MSRRFGNSSTRGRIARWAQKGPHYAAQNAGSKVKEKFEKNDTVRIIKTGKTAVVAGEVSWGDYELIGFSGYYSPDNLELVKKGSS